MCSELHDDDVDEEEAPPEEDLGEQFRGLNCWGYTATQWDAIVKKDIRRVRHWGTMMILSVGAWILTLRWMGVLSMNAWMRLNCGHPEEILAFLT